MDLNNPKSKNQPSNYGTSDKKLLLFEKLKNSEAYPYRMTEAVITVHMLGKLPGFERRG